METIERVQENVFERRGYRICGSLVSLSLISRFTFSDSDSLFFFRDTVNSVGLIPHALPFTTSNTVVNTFRHAISLDERRAKFKANLWNRPEKFEELLSISDQKVAKETEAVKGKTNSQHQPHHRASTHRELEGMYSKSRLAPTDVDEVKKDFYLNTFD